MTDWLIDPNDTLEQQNAKLRQITGVLMRRVEQDTDRTGVAYRQFERAALLEDQVRQRTADLEHALDLLNESNARLAEANRAAESARADLSSAIETIQEGFALFNARDELVMCNSRFGMHMLDLQTELTPGLSFARYVELVSRSKYLALPEGVGSADWAARRLKRHQDNHVIFNVRMVRDRWVQVSEHRTHDGGTVIMQTDVTDIMRLEREERDKLLDGQSKMLRATLDHLNQGVVIFDSDSRLMGWNKRVGTLLALPLNRFRLGTQFQSLLERFEAELSFESEENRANLWRWVMRKTNRKPISFEVKRRDGMILDVFAQEMPDKGFVISFTDVTAEREATRTLFQVNELLEQRVMERTLELEDALSSAERANASKSRFVAAASHDLLQPLSAAKLYVSALDGPETTEATREIAHKAHRALLSVENIIDALLDISKLEAGMAALEVSSVPLNTVFDAIREQFSPLAAQKGLEFKVMPCAVVLESDPSYLRRIVANLVSNAIRYTAEGRVLVGARRNGNSIRIEVWDTGPGIPEAKQDIIFQEFERLDAKASASEGLGLGLAIVERACARLGHPLGLWSVMGQGSGFFVNVARSMQPHLTLNTGLTKMSSAGLQGSGMIVLLVENDLDLRRAMTLLLEKWDISVLDVHGASEAVELLDEIEIAPDAMLIDYQLDGGENGLDLIRQVQARHGAVPTRLISANRSPELRARCAAQNIELLNKPIDARTLERFLTEALKSARDFRA
ncbi:PAS-domain containing protein [Dinoroseobacter shibae]|jgi:signal transduction histidine kinase/CheY-like chemotaxis protein|uniref:hybrid sensor histidine kinase/response regulator n=1 Tax=Dinoroseobacter shibae TaxID=215813 RepID=UPI002020B163|nr:PAS-domain containing protein [Dinoroseobacter shibae]URF50143.1 PAS-domain containing protein [Dinoroseobacter shibae]